MASKQSTIVLPDVTAEQRKAASDALTYGDKARASFLSVWIMRGNAVPAIDRPDSDGFRVGSKADGECVGQWRESGDDVAPLPENIRHLAVALVGKSQWTGWESRIPGANVPMTPEESEYWGKVNRVAAALKNSSVYAGRPVVARKRAAAPNPGTGASTAPSAAQGASQAPATGTPAGSGPDRVAAFNAGVRKAAAAVTGLAALADDESTYVLSEVAAAIGAADGLADVVSASPAAVLMDRAISTGNSDPLTLAAALAYVARFAPVAAPAPVVATPARARRARPVKVAA